MQWWKAVVLGTLIYVVISLVLSSLAFIVGAALCLIPFVGILLALVLNFSVTFAESVFSGFIAGHLSDKNKGKAGFITGFLGSALESVARFMMFMVLAGIVGVGSMLNFAGITVPLDVLVGGSFVGTFLLGLTGIISVIIACFGGYSGALVSKELPLSRMSKEIQKTIKAVNPLSRAGSH